MTDYEALQITMKITEFRMHPQYQAAEELRRKLGARTMADAELNSNEHAAIRLLIGTWDRIAMFIRDFNDNQRRQFFKCNPVLLVWQSLQPAVYAIRGGDRVGPNFAREFERLAEEYDAWTRTDDGQEFRTTAQQTVCALFA